jgi:hypothetical protein
VNSHWITNKEAQSRILDELLCPFHTTIHSLRPFEMNPNVFSGEATTGDRFMRPTGSANHHLSFAVTGDDEDQILSQWDIYVSGFWKASCAVQLSLPFPMREIAPVWRLDLRGAFADSVVGNEMLADQIENILMRTSKRRVREGRRLARFYPRGPSCTIDGYRYTCEAGHDYAEFSGKESLEKDGAVLWSATFHGGILIPISCI